MRTGIAAIVVVAACGKGGGESKDETEERTMAARATEAEVHLRTLQKALDVYAVEMGRLPDAVAPLTPAKPCCQGPDQQCPAGGFDAEIWKMLDFAIDVPHRYRFSYDRNGDEAVVAAVADLDCDGVETTYTLTATPAPGGSPTFQLVRPSRPD
jgi:hypothetical protein